jgi:hypothetical protein
VSGVMEHVGQQAHDRHASEGGTPKAPSEKGKVGDQLRMDRGSPAFPVRQSEGARLPDASPKVGYRLPRLRAPTARRDSGFGIAQALR